MENYTKKLKSEIIKSINLITNSDIRAFCAVNIKYLGKIENINGKNALKLIFTSIEMQKFFIKYFSQIFDKKFIVHNSNFNSYYLLVPNNYYDVLNNLELLTDENNIINGLPPELINNSKNTSLLVLKIAMLLKGNLLFAKNHIQFFFIFDHIMDAMVISGILKKFNIESMIKSEKNDGNIKLLIKGSKYFSELLGIVNCKVILEKYFEIQNVE